ncbi:TetR/AcrR family transcriptional regulator [Isoptericola cucumis]|uniref:TetR family transcriptional regulator n=1 Tax=Isoptericola cucumis TaxID=1776856 RepID=A0ABQ2B9N9_9MICO|nr:TetR/AcrR family transcriptional regulator [Isoptericola cucumis]GGI11329.1 TetR family transcriptional regulator [Isoptericola cucumis]
MSTSAPAPTDGRRLRGDRSRRAVLDRAVHAASVDGLDGLTFGSLAAVVPVNKSGIAGLFGSKEGLQLAVVAHAREVFRSAVVLPALDEEPGLARLWRTVLAWLDYSRDRIFEGGCFFRSAATELDARTPGPVRDAVVAALRDWDVYLVRLVRESVERRELAEGADAEQLVFSIDAALDRADLASVLLADPAAYDRARRAVRGALVAAGASAPGPEGSSAPGPPRP